MVANDKEPQTMRSNTLSLQARKSIGSHDIDPARRSNKFQPFGSLTKDKGEDSRGGPQPNRRRQPPEATAARWGMTT
jgi:hypothetical protein